MISRNIEPQATREPLVVKRDSLDEIDMALYVNNQLWEVRTLFVIGHWSEDKITAVRYHLECKYQEYCKYLAKGIPVETAYAALMATVTKIGNDVQEAYQAYWDRENTRLREVQVQRRMLTGATIEHPIKLLSVQVFDAVNAPTTSRVMSKERRHNINRSLAKILSRVSKKPDEVKIYLNVVHDVSWLVTLFNHAVKVGLLTEPEILDQTRTNFYGMPQRHGNAATRRLADSIVFELGPRYISTHTTLATRLLFGTFQ